MPGARLLDTTHPAATSHSGVESSSAAETHAHAFSDRLEANQAPASHLGTPDARSRPPSVAERAASTRAGSVLGTATTAGRGTLRSGQRVTVDVPGQTEPTHAVVVDQQLVGLERSVLNWTKAGVALTGVGAAAAIAGATVAAVNGSKTDGNKGS
jgi:hypothetical protein